MIVDLHCHSCYSDGLLSPEALLAKALAANVNLLALTDHDTIDGIKLLQAKAHQQAIHIINGVELSVRWKKYDIHVLGLNFTVDERMILLLQQQKLARIARAKLIGERLEACGVQDAYSKAVQLAGHEQVGRLHFAQILIDEGKVPDKEKAFKRYLGSRCKAFVPTEWVDIENAVQTINECKGQAVLAHPLKYRLTRTKLHELIIVFKAAGGAGLEVISGDMTAPQVEEMVGLTNRYDLLASTGSDFHGEQVSRVQLGRQRAFPTHCKPVWHSWNI